jgi:D-3-phosphoglycerate dehydrogenase
MRIAVLDDYQDVFRTLSCFPRLAGHDVRVFQDSVKDPDGLARRLADMDAVVLTMQRTPLVRATVEQLPKLRLVCQTGRNLSHIDMDACAEHGIEVATGGSGGPNATAELAWGLILSALRHIPDEVARLKAGQWQGSVGDGLNGKTLGIYAFGNIGALVAAVGRAFGMRVLCWGREGSLARARDAGYEVAGSRESFFAAADVLSLHIPLKAETRGIVTAADLALMKPTALLVNTSRAPIIASGALVEALRQGRPGRAAADVYEEEPVLNAADPLIGLPNTTCTPHLGYVERGTYEAIFSIVVDQLLAHAAKQPVA